MLGWGDSNVNFYGATAHSGPGPHRYRGFMMALIYTTPHSVGLLWRTDQPDAETSTWQYISHKRQIAVHRWDSNSQTLASQRP
jgi:hypothetical protein